MKLKIGDVISVTGWVMMDKLDDGGKYRVQSTPPYYGRDTYQFTKPKGKKIIVRHLSDSVDGWLNLNGCNRINIL